MPNRRSQEHFHQALQHICTVDAKTANTVGYIPRFMANSSFPAREQLGNEFIRTNGNRKLTLLAPSDIGLPYGTYARKLTIYLSTQAKLSGKQNIYLGSSMADLLRSLGTRSTGGKTGTLQSFRNQALKLFACSIVSTYQSGASWHVDSMNLVSEADLLWIQGSKYNWESEIKLTLEFLHEILKYGIPVDLRVVEICSNKPLAMDIYFWLTYRFFNLQSTTLVPWAALEAQFGNVYKHKRHFKRNFIKELNWLSLLYPEANYQIVERGVLLHKSETHVSRMYSKRTYH